MKPAKGNTEPMEREKCGQVRATLPVGRAGARRSPPGIHSRRTHSMNVLSSLVDSERWPKSAATLAITALAVFFANSDGNAQHTDRGATNTVQGTVRRSTTAPMGQIDGAVLDDGTLIHWPPHLGDRMAG